MNSKAVFVGATLALLLCLAFSAAEDVEVDAGAGMEDDAHIDPYETIGVGELDGDSPVRQSQRQRRAERTPGTGSESSLLEVSASVENTVEESAERGGYRKPKSNPPGPAWNRLTGAAKSYHPNDQMCVVCQFLVERTQLDLAHFNIMGNQIGAPTAASGSASNAAAGGANAGKKGADEGSFIQLDAVLGTDINLDMDATEAEWAEQDAKDAASMEISAKQELYEQEGDWDALENLQKQAKAEHDTEAETDETEDETEEDSEESEEESDTEEEAADESDSESVASGSAAESGASSFSETSAVVTAGLSVDEKQEFEEILNDIHNDKVSDSVEKQIEQGMREQNTAPTPAAGASLIERAHTDSGDNEEMDMDEEEVTPEMVSNGERAELIAALSDQFDKDINLSADEKDELSSLLTGKTSADDGWAMPTYNENGLAESDTDADGSEVVEATDVNDEETLPIQFIEIESRPYAKKSYARMVHRPETWPAAAAPVAGWPGMSMPVPVMAEMSGQNHHFMSNGGRAQTRTRSQAIKDGKRRRRPKPIVGVGVAHSPRRFRLADALAARPNWNRFDPTVQPHPNAQRMIARDMWNRILQMTYDRLEGYCSTRLPEQFTPFCRPLLKRFRVVAEGLRYGDRPNQICMRTRFCPRGSYVRRSPHNVFKHVSGRKRGRQGR